MDRHLAITPESVSQARAVYGNDAGRAEAKRMLFTLGFTDNRMTSEGDMALRNEAVNFLLLLGGGTIGARAMTVFLAELMAQPMVKPEGEIDLLKDMTREDSNG